MTKTQVILLTIFGILVGAFSLYLDYAWTKHALENISGKEVDNLTIVYVMTNLEK